MRIANLFLTKLSCHMVIHHHHLLYQHCHRHWYNKWMKPQKLVFYTDRCLGGYRLDYCVKGDCPPDAKISDVLKEHLDEVM